MKIYFAASIRGGQDYARDYKTIISQLSAYGKVLTEHIGENKLDDQGENISDTAIFERDTGWLRESDIIVAEVTQPSLGVGYEIALGESLGIRIICLFKQKSGNLSAMIKGNKKLEVIEYTSVDEIPAILKQVFQ
ncbi:2'-deoxynucleoside 5'-phosphate N-hydrolase 1 [subsurface metagenome]